MDETPSAMRSEIEELKKKLTEEKLSNMELDLSNNDQTQKVHELEQRIKRTEDTLVAEKFKSQNLYDQIQALQIEQSELIEYYEDVIQKSTQQVETVLAEHQEQVRLLHSHIVEQNAVIAQQRQVLERRQLNIGKEEDFRDSEHSSFQSPPQPEQVMDPNTNTQRQSNPSNTGRRLSFSRPWHSVPDASKKKTTFASSGPSNTMTQNGGDGADEFEQIPDDVLKIDDQVEDSDSELSDNRTLRHRLVDEVMEHEKTKHRHRESISALQQISNGGGHGQVNEVIDSLQEEVAALKEQLENERRKREHLDKERRNSLAALSQNMFKKLLDSEHQHYDDKSDLEGQCQQLKSVVRHLEMSKQNLLKETSTTIDDLRKHIKLLSRRLQKYENWD